MAYGTKLDVGAIDKGQKIERLEDMPSMSWCLLNNGTLTFFVNATITEGKATFIRPYGQEGCWDAEAIWPTHSPVTLLYTSAMTLKGDDRPIFDTREEVEALEVS